MASIDFYINTGADFDLNSGGSGLGFFGTSFGASVAVGAYQGTTYVTDGNGVVQGPQGNNVKFVDSASGEVAGATQLGLLLIPNYQSSINIRFTHSSSVNVQNVEGRIYDRNSINNAASGVTTKMAEIIHPDTSQTLTGSGDSSWITPAGSGIVVGFAQSPGESGQYAGDGLSTKDDLRHDWYSAISASPDSIGSKTLYGLYFSLEYL